MAQAAKEKGNLCNEDGDYKGALERYTLALTLDPNDFCALSDRARTHLEVPPSQKPLVRLSSLAHALPHNSAWLAVVKHIAAQMPHRLLMV